jgi:anaerobic magnesium-protoporphyrin IX monomethyl ester cyclase
MAVVPRVARAPVALGRRVDVDFTDRTRRPVGEGLRVFLVGFQDQDNLGVRYLAAAAGHHGHDCRIVTYEHDPASLCSAVTRERPHLVGLSLIFQYMAPAFGHVIEALRASGYEGHITMGGHYPSFEPAEVLEGMPGLDSVVRFEGEATLVELLSCLESGRDWRPIAGIAWRDSDGAVVVNPHRESIDDLDALPPPERADIDYEHQALPTASVLGSRGCPWNCSFCSIRPFYEAQGGALRRLRAPAAVAEEMLALYRDRGVVAFLFQDDDFLAIGRRGREWAIELARAVADTEMRGRVSMKISCRSDEVHEQTMRELRDLGGLTHVYLGVESGDDDALAHLNKQLRPEAHLRAARVLRDLGLSFDFGFMLLEPYSDFANVRGNIDFLEEFVGDGATVATFCRTLPYAGTPLKQQLIADGRLLGTPFEPDYRFLDPRLDVFYDWMLQTFRLRNFTDQGLCHLLRSLQFELHLRVAGRRTATDAELAYGRHLTAVCNRVAFYTLRAALDHVEAHSLEELHDDPSYLVGLADHEARQEARLTGEVLGFYRSFREDVEIEAPTVGGFQRSWTLDEVGV